MLSLSTASVVVSRVNRRRRVGVFLSFFFSCGAGGRCHTTVRPPLIYGADVGGWVHVLVYYSTWYRFSNDTRYN